MATKFTTNEQGLIETVTINGKPASKGFIGALRKAEKTPYWKLYTHDTVCQHALTRMVKVFAPLEASVYDWCTKWYRLYSRNAQGTSVTVYDRMRYGFLDMNPEDFEDWLH